MVCRLYDGYHDDDDDDSNSDTDNDSHLKDGACEGRRNRSTWTSDVPSCLSTFITRSNSVKIIRVQLLSSVLTTYSTGRSRQSVTGNCGNSMDKNIPCEHGSLPYGSPAPIQPSYLPKQKYLQHPVPSLRPRNPLSAEQKHSHGVED